MSSNDAAAGGRPESAPIITTEQAWQMLAILGIRPQSGQEDRPEAQEPAFAVGLLLALAEAQAREFDRAELPVLHAGYIDAVIALAGGDPEGAGRGWAALLNDRLNRTVIELAEATEGTGRGFIEVAGPALAVAANMLALLNKHGSTVEEFRHMLTTADGNLKSARRNLGALREQFRKDGMPL